MQDFLKILLALRDTPVPVILVGGGILFLFIAVGGQLRPKVATDKVKPKYAAIVGALLLVAGTSLYVVLSVTPEPTPTDVADATSEAQRATPILPPPANTPLEPPTNTPAIEPTGTPIPTTAPTPAVSPEQAIRDYYSAINNRQYEVTWARLSTHFKDKFNCCTPEGYHDFDAYVQWWDSVARVDIGETRIIAQSGSTATVFAQLSYLMNSGNRTTDYKPYIQLVFDPTTHTWVFYDKGPNP